MRFNSENKKKKRGGVSVFIYDFCMNCFETEKISCLVIILRETFLVLLKKI